MNSKKKRQAGINSYQRLFSFFPIQLFRGYLKYNHLILLSWLVPFLIVGKAFGSQFGLPVLFLAPEYLGHVNISAFLFMGMATGSFIMAFHIASYIVMAHRYPFIVTLSKPFYKYAINNSFIPLIYLLFYLYQSASFQASYELIDALTISFNLLAFLLGVNLFVFVSFGFFFLIVRKVPNWFKPQRAFLNKSKLFKWVWRIKEKDKAFKIKEAPIRENQANGVEIYIKSWKQISRTGRFKHYKEEAFSRVFYYQHRNAFYYVLFILGFILIRGLAKDQPAMILPAAASFQLMLTITILVISLFYILFRRWTFAILSLIILIAAFASPDKILSYNNNGYGLNYNLSGKRAEIKLRDYGNYHKDSLSTVNILNRWLKRNTNEQTGQKPKMVVICSSGGGLKMAVWTYYALAYADSCLNGKLLQHTELITGASGGMLGAAYIRELYLRKQKGLSNLKPNGQNLTNISKDILNPVFYTFSMSDWFFRLQTFRYQGKTYYKDRAYMFEQTINRNLGPILDKPLYAYHKYEQNAEIPLLIFSPTIENTGAQLIISSQNVSYLTKTTPGEIIRNIEFRHNYKNFGADSLRFLSAIRMNASFPYVSPDVLLPGNPQLVVMDAGMNDNFGYLTAFRFITNFKQWIEKNTSGIILIQLNENDNPKIYTLHPNILYRLLRPMGSLFDDWGYIQKNNYLAMLQSLKKLLPGKFQMIPLTFGNKKEHIALSWHLTKKEKQLLLEAIHHDENKNAINKLYELLRQTEKPDY